MVYNGRGVIYLASGLTLDRAMTSIRLLKLHGCKLPVEVWFIGEELTPSQLNNLSELKVTPRDILVEQKKFPRFASYATGSTYGSSRNYHLKGLAVILSRFKEIIYLDSDNYPLRDPTHLLDAPEYLETGALFWPDYWKTPKDSPMWTVLGLKCEDESEQESGQMVVNKEVSWRAMMMAMYFQLHHDFYFSIILGDKDTWRFGWRIADTPYFMIQTPAAVAGRVRQHRFCGHSMIQHDLNGEFLFVHTTAMKSVHGLRQGNTWENVMFYQQIPVHAIFHPSSSSNTVPADKSKSMLKDNLVEVEVSFPVTVEYAGGVENPDSTGPDHLVNGCLDFSVEPVVLRLPENSLDAGVTQSPSYQIVTQTWKSYKNGKFEWFEEAYFSAGGKLFIFFLTIDFICKVLDQKFKEHAATARQATAFAQTDRNVVPTGAGVEQLWTIVVWDVLEDPVIRIDRVLRVPPMSNSAATD